MMHCFLFFCNEQPVLSKSFFVCLNEISLSSAQRSGGSNGLLCMDSCW